MRVAALAGLLLCAGALSAHAQAPVDPPPEPPPAAPTAAYETPPPTEPIEDPLQGFNRGMFGVDLTVNKLLAGHGRILAMAKWIPVPLRVGLYNAFSNLDEPDTLANDLLQRKFHKGVRTAGRFAINSTIGVLGWIDVASHFGLRRTREDFGQTLAMWGVKPGPYIYLPFAGPTNFRDALSGPVDALFVPGHWFPMSTWERQGMQIVRYGVHPATVGIRQVARGAAEEGQTDDEYATLRQLFYDQRADQIADRPNLADDPLPAFPEINEGKTGKKPAS
jgi:phospholipid-binding lipoprotein MlaA